MVTPCHDDPLGKTSRKRTKKWRGPGGGRGRGASPCLTPHHGGARMSEGGKSRAHYSTAVSAIGLLAFGIAAAALGLPLWGYYKNSDGESYLLTRIAYSSPCRILHGRCPPVLPITGNDPQPLYNRPVYTSVFLL